MAWYICRSRFSTDIENDKIKGVTHYDDSKNAVLTQIMAALCVYLLIAYMKYQSRLTHSMQKILRLIHTNLFSRRDLISLFLGIETG